MAKRVEVQRSLIGSITTFLNSRCDPVDAQVLVQFAAERQPAPQEYHELRQRLVA
jgi:hypothetical protein